jgi:hypothetical protein
MAANEKRNISAICILNEPLIQHYVRKQNVCLATDISVLRAIEAETLGTFWKSGFLTCKKCVQHYVRNRTSKTFLCE